MESEPVGELGPAGSPGAPASKKDKEGSNSRSRRQWRKIKARGERAGAATARKEPWTSYGKLGIQWADPPPREVGGVRGLAHCRPAGGCEDDVGAEYTPSVETTGRPTTVLGGKSRMLVFWTRVPLWLGTRCVTLGNSCPQCFPPGK